MVALFCGLYMFVYTVFIQNWVCTLDLHFAYGYNTLSGSVLLYSIRYNATAESNAVSFFSCVL